MLFDGRMDSYSECYHITIPTVLIAISYCHDNRCITGAKLRFSEPELCEEKWEEHLNGSDRGAVCLPIQSRNTLKDLGCRTEDLQANGPFRAFFEGGS